MDEVVENLRALLLSSKGGVSVNRINKEYYDLVGERIPYRELNFETLNEFLSVVPGIRKALRGGEYFLEAIPTQKTVHMAELVRGQRTDKKKRLAARKPARTPYGYNQNSRNQTRPQTNYSRSYSTPSYSAPSSSSYGNSRNQPRFSVSSASSRNVGNGRVSPPSTSDYGNGRDSPRFSVAPASSRNVGNSRVSPTSTSGYGNSRDSSKFSVSTAPSKNTGNDRVSPKSPIKTSPGSSVTTSTKYPPSKNTDYVPLMRDSPRTAQFNERPVKNFNEGPGISPSKRMMDRDLRSGSTVPVAEATKPKSSLQDRLIVNSPNTTENGFGNESMYPIGGSNLATESQKPIEPEREASSIVPFESFLIRTPEQHLVNLANKLNLSAPKYVITSAKRGIVFASVDVGGAKFSSYPDEATTDAAARLLAAKKAINGLQKKYVCVELPVTKDESLMKERILKIVDCHPNGVFTSRFINYYKQEYNELLPNDWMSLVQTCPDITIERGAHNTSILTRSVPHQKQAGEDPIPVSPLRAMNIRSTPRALQVPKEIYWITYTKFVNSTNEIWVQLVGEEYDEKLDVMREEMGKFYSKNARSTQAKNIERAAYYAIYVSEHWHRVRCLDINSSEAIVNFIDSGDDETCQHSMLHELDPQFCDLPAQALRLSLYGLEEFADFEGADSIIKKHILERSLYVQNKSEDPECQVRPVIFFDTNNEYDINLNDEIYKEIIESCMSKPQLSEGRITEANAYISPTGEVYLQLRNCEMQCLEILLNKAVQNLKGATVSKVNLTRIHLIKILEDDKWYRCQVLNVNYVTNEVDVFLMDKGKTVTASMSSLVDLSSVSPILAGFPPQALQVHLHNLPPSSFDSEKVSRLCELVPSDQSLLVKLVRKSDDILIVELFKRQQPSNEIISINNTLVFDSELTKSKNGDDNNNVKSKRSERLTSRYGISANRDDPNQRQSLRPPKIPPTNEYFDVHVSLVSHPGNFMVQPHSDRIKLMEMHREMRETCQKYTGSPLTWESVKEGNLYAAHHSDGDWYRVCVLNKFTEQQMVTVYLCDFGDVTLVNLRELQPLPGQFRELPQQAIRAKLAGVKAVNVDWTVEDCLRFKELTEEKDMVSVVKAVVTNSSGEPALSLELIDVSQEEDVHIDAILIREGRARRAEPSIQEG